MSRCVNRRVDIALVFWKGAEVPRSLPLSQVRWITGHTWASLVTGRASQATLSLMSIPPAAGVMQGLLHTGAWVSPSGTQNKSP